MEEKKRKRSHKEGKTDRMVNESMRIYAYIPFSAYFILS